MLGLKGKINTALLAVMFLASASIMLFSYRKSSEELNEAVEVGNTNLARATAAEIASVNSREFKMLEGLSNLNIIKDPDVDMHDKWVLINSATGGSKQYFGMAIYNERGIGWTTTEKWSDLHTREYLAKSMTGIPAIMDPNWSPVNGNVSTFYALPVRDSSGRQIAEVVSVLDSLELCRKVEGITVGRDSHPFVINRKTGKFVAHADTQLIKDGKSITDDASENFKPVIELIKSGQSLATVYYDEIDKMKYSVAFQPVPECDWSVVVKAPYSDFYSGIGILLRTMVLIAAIALVAAAVVGFSVVTLAMKPLSNVQNAIADIASGEADLSRRLTVKTKDEIGMLAAGFNSFTEKMHTLISELKNSKSDLNSYGNRLAAMVQDNATFLSEMMDSIDDVNREIRTQHEKVGSSVEAVDEISSAVETLRNELEKQKDGVEQASAAVTEMIGNINSVSSSVEKMVEEFERLQADVAKGIEQQHDVSEKITNIEEQSRMLNEANKVISSIASETNLLAMNAAIEAAHAGDAGKGFAVVADEIRKLSENSSSESKKISAQLKGILDSISNVVDSSAKSDASFSSVVEKLRGTGNLVRQIKLAMDEQSEGSKQIGSALGYMNEATEQVREASNGVDKSKNGIIEDIESLRKSSDSVKKQVERMSGNIKRMKEDDDSLLNISTSINGAIYRIGNQIDRFKL